MSIMESLPSCLLSNSFYLNAFQSHFVRKEQYHLMVQASDICGKRTSGKKYTYFAKCIIQGRKIIYGFIKKKIRLNVFLPSMCHFLCGIIRDWRPKNNLLSFGNLFYLIAMNFYAVTYLYPMCTPKIHAI